jgi:hypothetical protein
MTAEARRLFGDWRGYALVGLTLVFAIAALVVPAMPQPLAYHGFADGRTLWGVGNFFNVQSNAPFLIAGILGLVLIGKGGGRFVDPREKLPYVVFFVGAALTCFGSSYYHLAPDNPRLVWDRLPMTLGFSGLVAAAIAERVDLKLGLRVLWPMQLIGVLTVVYWSVTEQAGAGNVIPYAAFQFWSIAVIVLVMSVFPAKRYTHGRLLAWAALWYFLAKVFEAFDAQIYRLLGGALSGHSIKHVLASFAVFAIAWQLHVRRPLP